MRGLAQVDRCVDRCVHQCVDRGVGVDQCVDRRKWIGVRTSSSDVDGDGGTEESLSETMRFPFFIFFAGCAFPALQRERVVLDLASPGVDLAR